LSQLDATKPGESPQLFSTRPGTSSFCKITLPLARPAIISGALLAFTVSFEDFVTSFFIAGIGIVTMPIKAYSMMKFGVTPEINALATCLLALTVVFLGGERLLNRRSRLG